MYGGRVSERLHHGVSHVIITKDNTTRLDDIIERVQRKKEMKVVDKAWVDAVVKAGKWVEEEQYLVYRAGSSGGGGSSNSGNGNT